MKLKASFLRQADKSDPLNQILMLSVSMVEKERPDSGRHWYYKVAVYDDPDVAGSNFGASLEKALCLLVKRILLRPPPKDMVALLGSVEEASGEEGYADIPEDSVESGDLFVRLPKPKEGWGYVLSPAR